MNTVQFVATNPVDLMVNSFYLEHPTLFWVGLSIILITGLIIKIKE